MSLENSTVIAKHSVIKGELQFKGPAVIAGRVHGPVTSTDSLEIAVGAVVEGDIKGVDVDVQGTVKGNIIATNLCKMGAKASVVGEVAAGSLMIARGATYIGNVCVESGEEGAAAQGAESVETVEMRRDVMEEAAAVQAVAGAINRLEALSEQVEQYAALPVAPIPGTPMVRVVSQAVQTLNRSPRIIKAR